MSGCARVAITIPALVALLFAPACEKATPPPDGKYACLIIKNLSGKDDLVVSPDFPKYHRLNEDVGGPASKPAAQSTSDKLLGTYVRVAVYDMDADDAQAAVKASFDRIAELSKKMNTFVPDSPISRVNRLASEAPQPLDDDLYRLVEQSLRIAKLTDGAFDPTVGPLTALWRKARAEHRLPDEAAVKDAMTHVGYQLVELDPKTHTVHFKREGMSLDVGGSAKGFAAEEAAKVLLSHGVHSAVIDCGGDLRLIGWRSGRKPFRVGIDDPAKAPTIALRFVVELSNEAIVTSGNYRQFTMIEGKRRSHLINPATGQSVEAFPSVTVTGPNAAFCDALATALSVVDEKTALKIIERANARLIPREKSAT